MELDFIRKAQLKQKGNFYEDFQPGQIFEHHWGKTLNEGDNSIFSSLNLEANPLYFNHCYANAHDHPSVVINPMLVFNTVFGLSVEDLSEAGGLFLGVDDLNFHRPVYPRDTLTARSEVISKRQSSKNPSLGIVNWHTQGVNQHDDLVIEFKRTNLVSKKDRSD